MRQTALLRWIVVFMMTLMALSGCGSGVTNVNGSLLSSITVTPATVSLNPGETQQFTAVGTYEDNTTEDITNKVTWKSSDKGKAAITNAGLATALAEGTTTITASIAWINNEAAVAVTPGEPGTGTNDTFATATPLAVPVEKLDALYDHDGTPDVDYFSVTLVRPGQIFIGAMESVVNYNLLDFDVIDVDLAIYDGLGNPVPTGDYWPYYYFMLMGDLRMPAWYTQAVVPAGTYYVKASSTAGNRGVYDIFVDTYPWLPTSTNGAPTARSGHQAVWTGTEMIVWGGGVYYNTGARYNPNADAWTPMTTVNAPSPYPWQPTVWTGSELLTWGVHGGGRYDPANDVWTSITTTNAPTYMTQGSIWTGTEMIVAPANNQYVGFVPGARYNLANDTWTPVSTDKSPECTSKCDVVWTGAEMFTWEGRTAKGSRYNPQTDTWTAISTVNTPTASNFPFVFWTGKEMIVWGGWDPAQSGVRLSTGAKYDPATNIWTPMSMGNAPVSPNNLNALWIGTEMITWGYGNDGSGNPVNEGQGRSYDPDTDTWTSRETRNAPKVWSGSTVVWTGSEIVTWGGHEIVNDSNRGARWAP